MLTKEKFTQTSLTLLCLLTFFVNGAISEACPKNFQGLKLRIGLVTRGEWTTTFQERLMQNRSDMSKCRVVVSYNQVMDEYRLYMPSRGWMSIEGTLLQELGTSTFTETIIMIGPYYASLAMVMDHLEMPYILTDEKGNQWTDRSRTQDMTHWNSTIDIRPPAREQNKAVVDLFLHQNWEGGVMVMPANTEDNYECHDLANQMIYAGKFIVKYVINTDPKKMTKRIASVIRNALYMTQTLHIICSPRESKHNLSTVFLSEASKFQLLKDKFRTFVFVDPTSNFDSLSGNNYFHMKLFLAKCNLYAFRYIKLNSFQMFPEHAIAQDVAEVTKRAIFSYIANRTAGFDFEKFMNVLKSVVVEDGKTGWIAFNDTGQRKNYTLYLYQHGQDNSPIAEWKPDGATLADRLKFIQKNDSFSLNPQGIFEDKLRIMIVEEKPFVFRDLTPTWQGFTIDLLQKLSKRLSFDYELIRHETNQYGVKLENGSWTGMVEEVRKGTADLGMGAISITSQRDEVVDFSLGILTTGVNILINKPKSTQNIFQFLVSFSLRLWMAIVGIVVGVSALYIILDLPNEPRQFTIKETLWFSVGTLMMRGTDFSPRRTSHRILTAGFTFFVLVIISTYTANLAAFLTMPNLKTPISTLEELIHSNMPCGTVKNTNTMAVLHKQYPILYKKMLESDGLVTSEQGLARANTTPFAFVYDYLINSYAEITHCGTMSSGAPILLQEHGIVMRDGAPFKTKINIELLKMKEEKVIENLYKRWWRDKNKCHSHRDDLEKSDLDVKDTAGVFLLLAGGLVCSLAFFLFKKFYLQSKLLTQQTAEVEAGTSKIALMNKTG